MKKFLLLKILPLLLFSSMVWAAPPSDMAAGVEVGTPYGLTAKYWLDKNQAIDANLGYTFSKFFVLDTNYLLHFPDFFRNAGMFKGLSPYIGAGPALFFATNSAREDGNLYTDDESGTLGIAVRVPVGIEWNPGNIGYFVEAAPAWGFIPKSFWFFGADIGARFYF